MNKIGRNTHFLFVDDFIPVNSKGKRYSFYRDKKKLYPEISLYFETKKSKF